MNDVIKALQKFDLAYEAGTPLIPDEEYDNLYRAAKKEFPNHPYFNTLTTSGAEVELPFQMGSLNQLYNNEDLESWKHKVGNVDVLVTAKLDGYSCGLLYEKGEFKRAFTRGDGYKGQDITRHVKHMNFPKTLPDERDEFIRCELIFSSQKFYEFNKQRIENKQTPYKNPRNAVGGVVNRKEELTDGYALLSVVAYDIRSNDLSKQQQLDTLKQYGFEVPDTIKTTSSILNELQLYSYIDSLSDESWYELDGVVVDADSEEYQHVMDGLNPKYTFKFKPDVSVQDSATITIKHIEWNVSKDGYLKPTVIFHPVDLKGVSISRATGFNAKFIVDNVLKEGQQATLVRSGDVIPFITGTTYVPTDSEIVLFKQNLIEELNSEFGELKWTDSGVDIILADNSSNEDVAARKLEHFFKTLKVKEVGEGFCKSAASTFNITDPLDLLQMSAMELGVIASSDKNGKKIHAEIRSKLNNVEEPLLMSALGVFGRGVSVKKLTTLFEAFKGNIEQMKDVNAVMKAGGFDKTAKQIVENVDVYQTIKMNLPSYVTFKPYEENVGGKFNGMTIVMTGFRSPALEDFIKTNGGKIGSSVSKNTSLLIANNTEEKSSKLEKARELGVQVISFKDFSKLEGVE